MEKGGVGLAWQGREGLKLERVFSFYCRSVIKLESAVVLCLVVAAATLLPLQGRQNFLGSNEN